eukprot:GILI01023872.1.p1 GENE.GILI01023872.1~~GILI01023872.1.p1  ORF type:complete len:214 (+),score=11.70 GILI01023872.1:27-644(+)
MSYRNPSGGAPRLGSSNVAGKESYRNVNTRPSGERRDRRDEVGRRRAPSRSRSRNRSRSTDSDRYYEHRETRKQHPAGGGGINRRNSSEYNDRNRDTDRHQPANPLPPPPTQTTRFYSVPGSQWDQFSEDPTLGFDIKNDESLAEQQRKGQWGPIQTRFQPSITPFTPSTNIGILTNSEVSPAVKHLERMLMDVTVSYQSKTTAT